MAGLWYRAGTVSVTNGSKKVVGTGTTWKSGTSKPDKGHTVWAPDGKAYELDYVESDTVFYLVTAYSGVTVSGAAYAIDISRSGTNSAFSRDLSAFVAYHQLQMDGWQQLLTGTGDVTLTAPDGTKLTVPSWEKIMNAGTGVVAQAKTEADRAKQEAQNAAASAVAASNAVVAAALPLPDVWAPLSDSLRLITGYGRDVLVGSDVVARMVNFSRSTTATYIGKDGALKTAAANEPRFEKEGLLIEGQSTNLVTKSEDLPTWQKNGVDSSGVIRQPGVFTKITPAGPLTGCYLSPIPIVIGKTYTISFWAYADTNLSDVKIGVERESGRISAVTTTPTRYSITFTAVQANGTICAYGASAPFYAGGFQLEELPFASSYIQTNGAAVTRAADEWNIPNKINCGPAPAMPMSVAVNFTCMGYVSFNNIFVAGDRQLMVYAGTNKLRLEQGGYSAIDITSNAVGYGGAQNKLRAACSDSRVACLLNGIMTERPGGTPIAGNGFDYFGSSKLRNQFGHIRDLRIWRIAFTNEQLKAIA